MCHNYTKEESRERIGKIHTAGGINTEVKTDQPQAIFIYSACPPFTPTFKEQETHRWQTPAELGYSTPHPSPDDLCSTALPHRVTATAGAVQPTHTPKIPQTPLHLPQRPFGDIAAEAQPRDTHVTHSTPTPHHAAPHHCYWPARPLARPAVRSSPAPRCVGVPHAPRPAHVLLLRSRTPPAAPLSGALIGPPRPLRGSTAEAAGARTGRVARSPPAGRGGPALARCPNIYMYKFLGGVILGGKLSCVCV